MKAITYEKYLSIKRALESGVKPSTVMELTGASFGTVNRIQNGKHKYDLENKPDTENVVAQVQTKTLDLSEVTRKLDNLHEAIKSDRLYKETSDKKLEMLLNKLIDAIGETNTSLRPTGKMV